MASATPAASLRGQNVQASDKYGIRRLWSPSSVAESGRYGDRSPKGNETGSKLRDYARIGILYYVVYDPTEQLSAQVLQVYELQVGRYQPRPDQYFPHVGLGVTLWTGSYEGQTGTWLRWCDAQGQVIPTGAERAAREAERATREAERAQQAAARAECLAAQLRALGVDPEPS